MLCNCIGGPVGWCFFFGADEVLGLDGTEEEAVGGEVDPAGPVDEVAEGAASGPLPAPEQAAVVASRATTAAVTAPRRRFDPCPGFTDHLHVRLVADRSIQALVPRIPFRRAACRTVLGRPMRGAIHGGHHELGTMIDCGFIREPRLAWPCDVVRMLVPSVSGERDRDAAGRPRQARPRDALGRPLPYGAVGVEPVPEEALPPEETLAAARRLVAEGRPFAAHEVLEARWKAGPDDERDLWQGFAQICVGLTHAARGNRTGAVRLLERGAGRIEEYAAGHAAPYGLDLTAVVAWARDRARESAG
jgi:hypothetical protein